MVKIKKRKHLEKKQVKQEVQEQLPVTPKSFLTLKNILLASIIILAIIFWKFKGNIIAATINGRPISRFELNRQLISRYGKQTLDNLINEKLLLRATRDKGIAVTNEEINLRIKEIEARLAGQTTLDEALKVQGLTHEDLKKQIEIQLSIDKMFTGEASVSAAEIDEYLQKNQQSYKSATDPVSLREEITAIIKQQKISELFDKWFSEVKKNARISTYL